MSRHLEIFLKKGENTKSIPKERNQNKQFKQPSYLSTTKLAIAKVFKGTWLRSLSRWKKYWPKKTADISRRHHQFLCEETRHSITSVERPLDTIWTLHNVVFFIASTLHLDESPLKFLLSKCSWKCKSLQFLRENSQRRLSKNRTWSVLSAVHHLHHYHLRHWE